MGTIKNPNSPTKPEAPPTDSPRLSESDARREHQKEAVRRVLAAGGDYGEAAAEAKVHRRTVARWMSEPVFARSVSNARAEQVQVVTGQLTGLATDAVAVLVELLATGTSSARLKAAQMVLEWGTRLRRDTEIEARVLELEARLGLADTGGDDGETS